MITLAGYSPIRSGWITLLNGIKNTIAAFRRNRRRGGRLREEIEALAVFVALAIRSALRGIALCRGITLFVRIDTLISTGGRSAIPRAGTLVLPRLTRTIATICAQLGTDRELRRARAVRLGGIARIHAGQTVTTRRIEWGGGTFFTFLDADGTIPRAAAFVFLFSARTIAARLPPAVDAGAFGAIARGDALITCKIRIRHDPCVLAAAHRGTELCGAVDSLAVLRAGLRGHRRGGSHTDH